MGRAFCCLSPLRFAIASVRSDCPASWKGRHLILFFRLLLSRDPLRRIERVSPRWVLGFYIGGRLERCLNCLKFIPRCCISVPFMDMLSKLIKCCWTALFVSLLTGCFWCRVLAQRYPSLTVLQFRPLAQSQGLTQGWASWVSWLRSWWLRLCADVLVDSHIDVRANTGQNFDGIREFCLLANVAVLQECAYFEVSP